MKYLPIAGLILFAIFAVIIGSRLGQDEIKISDMEGLVSVQSRHLADVEAKLQNHIDEKPAKKGDKK
jgi:hypothetical protein